MEPNAAVRSRLTHSFEVSQIGRYIADEVGQRLVSTRTLKDLEYSALVNFVETACLMHDIGNPPFGHFGEAAIQQWFREKGTSTIEESLAPTPDARSQFREYSPDLALNDFREFDGNPQGLRIVTRLQWNTDEFGLNLTKTTLASFLKYVRCAGETESANFMKKAGFFASERNLVQQVWETFDYERPQRFPLAYMMEAADDIAYCISDLEDSLEKGIVDEGHAFKDIKKRYIAKKFDDTEPCHGVILGAIDSIIRRKDKSGKEFTYTDFRTTLSKAIVEYVAERYVREHEKVISGELGPLLTEQQPPGAILEALKNYCREHVYTHESIQRIELAGFTAITGLLNHFQILLAAPRHRFSAALRGKKVDATGKRILIEPKLLKLFPPKYLKVYEHQVKSLPRGLTGDVLEWNARAHLVVDYVSGMTDDFAMTTYRTLAGMRV